MAKDLSGVQNGTVRENDVNNPSVKTYKGKNMFPQSFQHPSTCRYGEVDPVFAAKCEVGDVYPYKFDTDLDTFTLASKMKSKVKMKAAAFKVPMQAIYPRNWERMLTKPVQGDDVPEETRALFDVNAYRVALQSLLINAFNQDSFYLFVKYVLALEQVYSAGSLFSKFNMHLDATVFNLRNFSTPGVVGDDNMYFDDWFDSVFMPYFIQNLSAQSDLAFIYRADNELIRYQIAVTSELMTEMQQVSNRHLISIRRALELLRTGEYILSSELIFDTPDVSRLLPFNAVNVDQILNIEPIIAYQLACSHFFTNSKIDFVYSAQIYRDNMQAIFFDNLGFFPVYEYNGVTYQFDVFSRFVFDRLISENIIDFFINLFEFQRSLRYGDYFTGSRVAPLAVGDVNAPVVDNSVNAVDMTKKLQLTRYLNRVNITGPRIADYIRNILGGHVPEAPKDVPVKLSEVAFDVSGFEVNNTGSVQFDDAYPNITTSALRLTGQNYMFEASINEPCWLIGVQYFEAHRIYSRTMDRFAWHYDRYDDFIPDMQYIGDQEVKTRELDYVNAGPDQNFAYNLRYMEYKQRYSYASGGFIRALRTWAFITDNVDGNPYNSYGQITPEYIRSSPSEFDRFYKSLTGYSMGTYFHFITFNTNVCVPYRQMVYAPEILA